MTTSSPVHLGRPGVADSFRTAVQDSFQWDFKLHFQIGTAWRTAATGNGGTPHVSPLCNFRADISLTPGGSVWAHVGDGRALAVPVLTTFVTAPGALA